MTTIDGGDPRAAAAAAVPAAGGGTGAVSPGGPGGPGAEVAGDPVVRAVLDAAVDSTGASAGWVLAVAGSRLHAVAVAGIGGDALVGAHVALGAGTAGFVASSGNPLALSGASGDARLADGFVALTGLKPASVLCVPCVGGTDDVAGVIELVADTDGAFGFDDVEVATVLARVAAAALASGRRSAPPQPAALATRLEHLARADPARYAGVAAAVDALLPRG
jgi:GAF domain-containing protein